MRSQWSHFRTPMTRKNRPSTPKTQDNSIGPAFAYSLPSVNRNSRRNVSEAIEEGNPREGTEGKPGPARDCYFDRRARPGSCTTFDSANLHDSYGTSRTQTPYPEAALVSTHDSVLEV